MTLQLLAVIFSFFTLNSAGCVAGECQLRLEPVEQTVNAGYFDVSWHSLTTNQKSALSNGSSDRELFLMVAADVSFTEILQRIDVSQQSAVHLTGYRNGEYYLRLENGEHHALSNVVKVSVEHHALSRVWLVFAIGAIMFAILIGYLISRARNPQQS